jgi:hypothetical protein
MRMAFSHSQPSPRVEVRLPTWGNTAVGWSDVTQGRRSCLFCGGPANSREHIFKKAFKEKLGITEPLDRAFTQRDGKGVVTTRPDPLFEQKVRRVCRTCNNGWMNHLDLHVEGWIIDPDDRHAFAACDPKEFRRWAIKLALIRSLMDSATAVPRRYFESLFQGDVIEDWRVFVGRASFKEYRHAFSAPGGRLRPCDPQHGPRANPRVVGVGHSGCFDCVHPGLESRNGLFFRRFATTTAT